MIGSGSMGNGGRSMFLFTPTQTSTAFVYCTVSGNRWTSSSETHEPNVTFIRRTSLRTAAVIRRSNLEPSDPELYDRLMNLDRGAQALIQQRDMCWPWRGVSAYTQTSSSFKDVPESMRWPS